MRINILNKIIKAENGLSYILSRFLFMIMTTCLVILLMLDSHYFYLTSLITIIIQLVLWGGLSSFLLEKYPSPLNKNIILGIDCAFIGWWCAISGFNPWFLYFLIGISIAYLLDVNDFKFILKLIPCYILGTIPALFIFGFHINVIGNTPINIFGSILAIFINIFIGYMIFQQYNKTKDSKENLQKINTQLTQINEIATLANATLIPEKVFSNTIPHFKNLIDYKYSIVYLVDVEKGIINYCFSYGDEALDDHVVNFLESKPINIEEKESVYAIIAKEPTSKNMMVLKKTNIEYGYDKILYEHLKYKEAFIFPISSQDTNIGFITFFCDIPSEENYIQKSAQVFKLLQLIMVAHKNASLYQQIEENKTRYNEHNEKLLSITENLRIYLPEQIYSYVIDNENQPFSTKASRKFICVSFVEFRGLKDIIKDIEIEEFYQTTNTHYNEINNIVTKHGGIVDKFIGDTVLMFWGDPKTKGAKADTLDCIKAISELHNYFNNIKRTRDIWTKVTFSAAIHCGYCTVGNFGSEHKMSYTIIGTPVNLTSRLLYFSSNDIIISKDIMALVENEVITSKGKNVSVKGILGEFEIFSLNGLKEKQKESKESETLIEDGKGFKISLNKKVFDVNKASETADVLALAKYIIEAKNFSEAKK